MADHTFTKVRIVQRHLHPHTNTVQALTIAVGYGDGVEVEATISLRPMRRVGLIDITVGNATHIGASQRSTTRRCASHHIATQRLSRWGSPAACARLARTVPIKRLWLRDGHV